MPDVRPTTIEGAQYGSDDLPIAVHGGQTGFRIVLQDALQLRDSIAQGDLDAGTGPERERLRKVILAQKP
jgi:hypothetical protein